MQLLSMRKFAVNVNILATSKISLFLATKKYNSIVDFNHGINLLPDFTQERIANIIMKSIASCMEKV